MMETIMRWSLSDGHGRYCPDPSTVGAEAPTAQTAEAAHGR
jgi:hypothetical protein